jgi:hypothetical protein
MIDDRGALLLGHLEAFGLCTIIRPPGVADHPALVR